jgi:hypothetical protein
MGGVYRGVYPSVYPPWLCPKTLILLILIFPISYPFFFTRLRTLLHFFSLTQSATPFFSCASVLFAKNYPGWGYASK